MKPRDELNKILFSFRGVIFLKFFGLTAVSSHWENTLSYPHRCVAQRRVPLSAGQLIETQDLSCGRQAC